MRRPMPTPPEGRRLLRLQAVAEHFAQVLGDHFSRTHGLSPLPDRQRIDALTPLGCQHAQQLRGLATVNAFD